MKELRHWKKVYETDLASVAFEVDEYLERPSLIILTGDVGLGKTTFTNYFVKMVDESLKVTSPSYSIVNEMDDILHGDLYRLKSGGELVHLELPLLLDDKTLAFIEWGSDYKKDLLSLIPTEFSCYELVFTMNADNTSRDINFYSIITH
jgi:tRNA threonylcarbamoyladenosine biosynthesis protein TsaE